MWFKGHIGQEVSYTPRSDLDFGSLLCWASNEVGTQKIPCIIHVIHAGKHSKSGTCYYCIICVFAIHFGMLKLKHFKTERQN